MAWTDPTTKATGDLITAAYWNQMVGPSGNIAATGPGIVTTAGDTVYATGDNVLARLAIGNAGTVMSSTGSAVQWGLTLTNSISAGGTQTQAGATALTTMVNRVTVSGTDGDGVKLPAAIAGLEILIINDDSAQTIKVWPATGDSIDGGSANAVDANTLAAGSSRRYIAIDATNWYTASPAAPAGVPSDVVAYRASSAGTPTGWAEYTTARGRMVVGLVSGGTDGGTVGTALTNSQDKTHSHTGPSHAHTSPSRGGSTFSYSQTPYPWGSGVDFTSTHGSNLGASAGTSAGPLTYTAGTGATGTAATSDVLAYIQLMAIKSD
mgnify:CR=1 FL=1